MMPASSGDHAMKVILFLHMCQQMPSFVFGLNVFLPGAFARREVVLDVVDGVAGALANGTLETKRD